MKPTIPSSDISTGVSNTPHLSGAIRSLVGGGDKSGEDANIHSDDTSSVADSNERIRAGVEKILRLGEDVVLNSPKDETDALQDIADTIASRSAPEYLLQHSKKYQLLTAEEECDLVRKIHNGDTKALDRMVGSNIRLVFFVAKKYANRGLDFSDILQEGNMGLLSAIERFNPELGFRFSTYATWWIRQSIVRAIDNKSQEIRYPAQIQRNIYRYANFVTLFTTQNSRRPTLEEGAKGLDISTKEFLQLREYYELQHTVSLNNPLIGGDDSGTTTLIDFIPSGDVENPVATLEEKEIKRQFAELLGNSSECLSVLNEREKTVISLRFGLNDEEQEYTLSEIGEKLGVQGARIAQIENAAMKRLRRYFFEEKKKRRR